MIDIFEYIKQPKCSRQKHLNLSEKCIERSNDSIHISTMCRGLMGHILNTTIPKGNKIYVCHACNNGKCSNPNHLYWGTAKENHEDLVALGGYLNAYEKTIKKYGLEKTIEMRDAARKKATEASTKARKGVKLGPMSKDHKAKISESIKMWHKQRVT